MSKYLEKSYFYRQNKYLTKKQNIYQPSERPTIDQQLLYRQYIKKIVKYTERASQRQGRINEIRYLFRSMHNGELERDGLDVAKFQQDSFEHYGTDRQPALPMFEQKSMHIEYNYQTFSHLLLRRNIGYIDNQTDMYKIHKGK